MYFAVCIRFDKRVDMRFFVQTIFQPSTFDICLSKMFHWPFRSVSVMTEKVSVIAKMFTFLTLRVKK